MSDSDKLEVIDEDLVLKKFRRFMEQNKALQKESEANQFIKRQVQIDELKRKYNLFKEENQFSEGSIVVWKQGLKNRKYPEADQPAIVMGVLKEPVYDSNEDVGSPYFRERLDIVLGVLMDDGSFQQFHYNSSRFTVFSEPWI